MRYYLRQIAQHRGFSVVAILTLALAAALNGWAFTFLNITLFQASPIPDSSRVVALYRTRATSPKAPWSPADFDEMRRTNGFLAQIGGYGFYNSNFAAPGLPPEHIRSMLASGEFFGVLDVAPLLGRAIGPDDARPGAAEVAVVSEGFWRRQLGADPNVVGRAVRLNGRSVTVIGVMPKRFEQPFVWGTIDLWTALNDTDWTDRSNVWVETIGRLKPGETLAAAQAEGGVIAARLAHEHAREDTGAGIHLTPWEPVRRGGPLVRNIWFFTAAMSLAVLLVACANLASLQLARAAGRSREFAVRLALGASRGRLIGQLLAENVAISLAGGGLGILLAQWGMHWTDAAISSDTFDGVVFTFGFKDAAVVLALAVGAGLIFGIMPALFAAKTDIHATLKQGGRGATEGASRHRLRNLLVVTEIALSLMLLSTACYFGDGIRRYVDMDRGWRPSGLLVGNLQLPTVPAYATDAQCHQFFLRLEDNLRGVPGVQAVGLSGWQPLVGFWVTHRVAIEGAAPAAPGREPVTYENPVSPGYFAALGMRLVAGRDFSAFDREGSAPVVIVNASMARTLWPGGNAVHQRIRYVDGGDAHWAEVVGVVDDVHSGVDIFNPPTTALQTYCPLAQAAVPGGRDVSLALRVSPGAGDVGAAVRRAVARLDPDLPVFSLESGTEGLRALVGSMGILAKMLTVMALFGMLLASIGLYGVIANLVARRTPEIGIRMALGAAPRQVLTLVLGNGIRLAFAGAAAGVLLSFALYRVLAAILPGMAMAGLLLLAAITLAMMAVALAACWFPARRATKVDPVVALRAE